MKQQLTRVAVCIIAILLGCNIQAAKKVFTLGDSTMAPTTSTRQKCVDGVCISAISLPMDG